MCGICGFIDNSPKSGEQVLRSMVSTLDHRGPDDSGSYLYQGGGAVVGLGHTRLAIIELTSFGHQPMGFDNCSIIFNGEIYNYVEIREELKALGHHFKSNSDTEVILHSFREWGEACVSRFIGMFVFVILDKTRNEVFVFRDRAGVKPFYYYVKDGLLLFSSELKAFHMHPEFSKKIDVDSVRQYLDFGYVPSPNCIFQDCYKLPSGSVLKYKLGKGEISVVKYWDVKSFYEESKLKITYNEAKDKVESLLKSACDYRMVSDVPVGVFLSGGYDSTAVAALLQKGRKEKIKTFTIGFQEGDNEAPFAKKIAEHLGTEHKEYYCTIKDAQDIIPTLPYFFDEPFGDSSAIPTMLVSKIAKEEVDVALSADGGDEVFGGYTIYQTFLRNLALIETIPKKLRCVSSFMVKIMTWFVPKNREKFRHKLTILSSLLRVPSGRLYQELHRSYFKINELMGERLLKVTPKVRETIFDSDFSKFRDALSVPMAIDYSIYMENDILTKVDRATMSVSLEGREPLLDHRLTEFVARLPIEFKISGDQKRILKDIVHQYVPKKEMLRLKLGFTIPIYDWLKTDLRYLIDENLSPLAVERAGIFNVSEVQNLKERFLNGDLDDVTIIWKLLQFQLWHKHWFKE